MQGGAPLRDAAVRLPRLHRQHEVRGVRHRPTGRHQQGIYQFRPASKKKLNKEFYLSTAHEYHIFTFFWRRSTLSWYGLWTGSGTQEGEFRYTLYNVPDNLYGVFDHESQEWNGIVRELMDRKADLAVAPMTINFAR